MKNAIAANQSVVHSAPHPAAPVVRQLGIADYESIWQQMRGFTHSRDADTPDQTWLVEHPGVYTLGISGRREHFLRATQRPVVQTDRGGEVTWHGEGQAVIYPLWDLHRLKWNISQYVCCLQRAAQDVLTSLGITGHTLDKKPGVYVDDRKIAQLGVRVHKGRVYHGLSFNVNMDLAPFADINPCGFAGMITTDLATELGSGVDCPSVSSMQREIANALELRRATVPV